nr:hypothetical protein [Bryobacter aggregatus]
MTDVPYKIFNKVYAAHIPALLFVLRGASDRSPRGPAGGLGRHAGCNVLFDELIQVESKFGFKLELDLPAAEQRPKPQTGFVQNPHG